MTATLAERPVIETICLGKAWQKDAYGKFVLPERTLGWEILGWTADNLCSPDPDEDGNPLPWRYTMEQARLILWIYAIDARGRFIYRDIIIQRMKGWGKDPFAATVAAIEFVGPCRFGRWATPEDVGRGLAEKVGDPIARTNPSAWVQATAVAKEQNKNLMTLFPRLFSKECIKKHSIDIGKEIIYADHGARRIESVTSSPATMEGNRPSFVIRNETHHWHSNNDGHEMAKVIRRNMGKIKGGQARGMSITNAYEPGSDSVAQHQREAYEKQASGMAIDTGVLYDSLEAGSSVGLLPPTPPDAFGDGAQIPEQAIRDWLQAVLEAVRGDAVWLDVERLTADILDPDMSTSEARRFYLNQIVADEESWALPADIDATEDPELALARLHRRVDDVHRAGWKKVSKTDEVVLFGDGSKSDDSTAIMGCRLSDGYLFTVGVWPKPPGEQGRGWLAPRGLVSSRVEEAMERFNVVAFWFDPSHTKDDETGGHYWDVLIDTWHREYSERLQFWAVKSGDLKHSILWDMASPARTSEFVGAAETFIDELESHAFVHDGHPLLKEHMRNARRAPGRYGVSLRKDGRESAKKIDLAVCAVGARLLRRLILNKGLDAPVKAGTVWW